MPADTIGFAGVKSAWHNMGFVSADLTSAEDGMNKGGMNYRIYKIAPSFTLPDGTIVHDDTGFALWREPIPAYPTWQRLSRNLVSGEYDYMQNADVAQRVDMLAAETGWTFETCGALGKGETFFVCLNMGPGIIAGEAFDTFFTFADTRDGARSAIGYVSKIRTVCRNTFNLGISTASSRLDIAHYATMKLDTDDMMTLVAMAHKAGNSIDAAINALAEIKVTPEDITAMLDAALPMPAMPRILTMRSEMTERMKTKRDAAEYVYTQRVATASRARDMVISAIDRTRDTGGIQSDLIGTAYEAFNGITEYTTHLHGTGGARGRKMNTQSRAQWDMIGDGQKIRDSAYYSLTNGVELF